MTHSRKKNFWPLGIKPVADTNNWKPITLLKRDWKVFIRLMNARVKSFSAKLINPTQDSFMFNRFKGDHGLTLKIMMENAISNKIKFEHNNEKSEHIGLFLDNTKAYDRVHPVYFEKVLLTKLFFGNLIYVKMNGFLSDPFKQQRCLRQGYSISLILYNFSFWLLLLSLLNLDIQGYCMQKAHPSAEASWTPPPLVNLLTCANDVIIFVNSN